MSPLALATALNLVLLAIVAYQAFCLRHVKANLETLREAMKKGRELMNEASARLREQVEHNKVRERFIEDLLAQLPPAIEPHQEKQA